MEVAGTVFGVLGVAGLFSAVRDLVEKIDCLLDSDTTARSGAVQFKLDKHLLEIWSHEIGIQGDILLPDHHPSLDDPEIARVVFAALRDIRDLCSNLERLLEAPLRGEQEPRPLRRVLTDLSALPVTWFRNVVKTWLEAPWSTMIYDRHLRKRLHNTCEWILEREFTIKWLSKDFRHDSPKVLWINGPAGYGKSVLCAKLIQRLSGGPDKHLVAHYFVSADSGSLDKPFTVIKSWLFQLITQSPEALDAASECWDARAPPRASQDVTVKVLRHVLRRLDGCTLVVDGLDECRWTSGAERFDDIHDRDSAVGFFLAIAEAASRTKTRILLVSRKENYLTRAFNSQLVLSEDIASIAYSILPNDVNTDARALAHEIVDKKLPRRTDEERCRLAERIVAKSEGMFLWMIMLGEYLSGTKSESALVAFTPRPLTVLELIEALTIPDNDVEGLYDDDLPNNMDEPYISDDIVGLYESLVELRPQKRAPEPDARSSTVHIVHRSVRQYLIDRLPVEDGLRPIDQRLAMRHVAHERHLAIQRLRYLGMGHALDKGLLLGEVTVPRVFVSIAIEALKPCPRRPNAAPMHPTLARMINSLIDPRRATWSSLRRHIPSAESSPQDPACHALFVACDAGFEPVDYMLSQVKTPATTADEHGRTALHVVSAKGGNVRILQLLIDHHAHINALDNDWATPLHVACRGTKEDVVALLLDNGAGIGYKDRNGCTPLMMAVLSGEFAVVKRLLGYNPSVDSEDNQGLRPAHLAVKRASGGLGVLKLLSNQGADLNSKSNQGHTPLYMAALVGSLACLEFLLDRGVDLGSATNRAPTAAHAAAAKGHIDCLKLLLERGADATAEDGDDLMPIHHASMSGYVDCLKVLLDWTAIRIASTSGCAEPPKPLPKHGAGVSVQIPGGATAVQLACEEGQIECLMVLIRAGADVNAKGRGDWTAAMFASRNGHVDCLKALVEAGADVAARDSDGWTALHLCSALGHAQCIPLLPENGADIEAKENQGMTALIFAASSDEDTECFEALPSRDADVTAADNFGQTALHLAASMSHPNHLSLLRKHGIDINTSNNSGAAALHAAAAEGKVENLKTLLAYGANIGAKDIDGKSALHAASEHDQEECLSVLLGHGADVNARSNDGTTALHIACQANNTGCLQVLVADRPDFDAISEPHKSLTHMATISGNLRTLKLLLESGADPARLDSDGRSILHWCARTGSEVGMDLVLGNGGVLDALQRDMHGLSVLAMAIVGGHVPMAKRLLATVQGQFDFEDSLGRSLLCWARRNGSRDLVNVLKREAARKSVHLIEPAENLGHGEGDRNRDCRLGRPAADSATCALSMWRRAKCVTSASPVARGISTCVKSALI
ncbi:hypothetical protein GGTG_00930 [Gaeumannomyces tritici R3-111a-1]|uniref:Uncharacterized protein n=1 Tax=Gaeumannomyces tritici (strain R3-111a-1) TaxID=644352 RepID=J3NI47_GAET3|nr:hypothetical protein GGTG_00930 [Gaeumannomyces tritici R3-111a-1]EJT80940.1 hypothetical protein GGTG_00930 [Gaeumannomyces tritici R3-111a-1]